MINLRIRGQGAQDTNSILRFITDGGILHLETVVHDADAGTLSFEMDRVPVVMQASRRLDSTYQKRDQDISLRCSILFRHVVSCDLEDHTPEYGLDNVTILFGIVTSDDGEIYLGSVEEDAGTVLYSFSLRCEKLDIEICDLPNSSP